MADRNIAIITEYIHSYERFRGFVHEDYVLASRQNRHLDAAQIHAVWVEMGTHLEELRARANRDPNIMITNREVVAYERSRNAARNAVAC